LRYCHHCQAQFPDDYAKCLHCGGRLVSRAPGAAGHPAVHGASGGLSLLARREPLKAVPLLDALTGAGVRFTVIGEGGVRQVSMDHGSFGRNAAVAVYVAREDFPEAEAILAMELGQAREESLASQGEASDRCPACGAALMGVPRDCPDCGLVFQ